MNNREEILAKSRIENKDKDLFEREVQIKAGNIGACTAVILATIFFLTQLFVGGGLNYGLYAIVFSTLATSHIVKAIRMKQKNDIVYAVFHTVVTLISSFNHLYGLIVSSAIL